LRISGDSTGLELLLEKLMDFTLSPEIEDYRLRVRAFIETHVRPLESQPAVF